MGKQGRVGRLRRHGWYLAEGFLAGLQGLEDKGVDRHWPDPARDRCIGGHAINQRRQFNIPAFLRVEAGIDHHCAILDPVCLDEFRFSHGADNNVCLLRQCRQVLGAAVSNGDGGIAFELLHGHVFAHHLFLLLT